MWEHSTWGNLIGGRGEEKWKLRRSQLSTSGLVGVRKNGSVCINDAEKTAMLWLIGCYKHVLPIRSNLIRWLPTSLINVQPSNYFTEWDYGFLKMITAFWNIPLFSLVDNHRSFPLHSDDGAVRNSEKSVNIYETWRHNIPKGCRLQRFY